MHDLLFRKMLSSNENKDVLQGFIRDFFDLDVALADIEIVDPYSIDVYRERLKALEGGAVGGAVGGDGAKAVDETNAMREVHRDIKTNLRVANAIIEAQIRPEVYFVAKELNYLCTTYCDNYNAQGLMEALHSGKPNRYSSLRPVYLLGIAVHNYLPADDVAFHMFTLYDKAHGIALCNGERDAAQGREWLRLGFFELGKSRFENKNHRHWRDLFVGDAILEDAPGYIKKAREVIELVNLSEEERKMISVAERNDATRDNELDFAYLAGKEDAISRISELVDGGYTLADAIAAIKSETKPHSDS